MRYAPLLACLSLLGCASVSGLSGYTFVDDEDPSGGSGGSGGTAGASGAAGLGGAGSGGSAGGTTCGGPSSVDEAYARACALAIACTAGNAPPSLAQCIAGDELPNFGNPSCILTKKDCDGYFACTGERRLNPATCGAQGWSCNGDVATGCGPSVGLQIDCQEYGGQCRTTAQLPGAFELVYPCELPTEVACDEDRSTLGCAGDFSIQCAQGKAYGRTCSKVGECLQGSCVTSAEACTTAGARCDGDKRIVCSKEQRQRTVDCAQAGLTCVEGGGQAACLAPGCSAQDVAACQDRCDGATAVICLGGGTFGFDCASIGATCVENLNGNKKVACSFLCGAAPGPAVLRG